MQPYAYGPYPNNGTMPVHNMVPANYQPYNDYNGVPQHPPSGYVPGYMAPGLPPPPMSAMMPIMTSPQLQQQQQHPQGYYQNPCCTKKRCKKI